MSDKKQKASSLPSKFNIGKMNSQKAEKPRPVGYPSSKDRGFTVPKDLSSLQGGKFDVRNFQNADLRTAEKALLDLGLKDPQIETSRTNSAGSSSSASSTSVAEALGTSNPPPTREDFEKLDSQASRTRYCREPFEDETPRDLNEVLVYRGDKDHIKHNLVLLHGAMAGLAYFYRNLEPLSRKEGWGVYAIDWIGMGRSSRPSMKPTKIEEDERIKEIEEKFIDKLEEWRIKRLGKNAKFTLVGHSFGGYLGMRYALKYSHGVNKIIMVSPVGVEKLNPGRRLPPPTPSSPSSSATDEGHTTGPTTYVHKPWFHRPLSLSMRHQIIPPFLLPKVAPITSALSLTHPVASWMSKRLSDLRNKEASAWLFQYTLRLLEEGVGGDSALCYLADAGVVIKKPLCGAAPELVKCKIPSTWIYGEEDWMDPEAGRRIVESIKLSGGRATFEMIGGAGHQIYLDKSKEFNDLILKEMQDVESSAQAGTTSAYVS